MHFSSPPYVLHRLPISFSWFYYPNNFGVGYRLLSSSLCSILHSPVTSSVLGPNIFLSTQYSKTFNLCSSLSVSDQVSYLHKTSIITVWINLLFILGIANWKATDTHSEYATLIAFPRQKYLHERAWILSFTYITGVALTLEVSRSQWPRGLRRRSTAARLLGLWVRIPPGAWMFVCCECSVL